LAQLSAFFDSRGVAAYATGGFLRDALLQRPVNDIDISVEADPLTLGQEIAVALGGRYFALDKKRRLARVLLPGAALEIDLLPLRASIEEDLRSRDYTIDAMAAPLAEAAAGAATLIDPANGLADLRSGLVRLVSETALEEDSLRLLRGVRLAAVMDFEIEPASAEAIRRRASSLVSAAAERQRDELARIFSARRAGRGMRLLDDLGLLDQVMPEMSATRGVEQPKEHYYDVLGHSFAAVDWMDCLLAEEQPDGEPACELWRELWRQLSWWAEARSYFRERIAPLTPRSAVVKLAAFLHDVGKPQTKTVDEAGRMRFFGHSEVGADIARRLMRRLRFSGREVRMVEAMVEAHLRPVQMAQQGLPTRRAIYRFFRDTGEAGIDTLFLSLADHLATVGPRLSAEGWRDHVSIVNYVLQKRLQEEEVVEPARLLRGDELMEVLGLTPGPLVGELLEAIREAQAAGDIATREEALDLARRHLAERL
jgi:putative nucleotidyltransferase with HDIG domain